MHHASVAACPSLRPPSPPAPSLAELIGETVLLAAAAIAQALHERGNGGLSDWTRQQGSDLIAQLYVLQRACTDEGLDFDRVAREFGRRAIVRRWDQLKHAPDRPNVELTGAMIDELVDWPLSFLNRVVRARMH